MFSVNPKKKRTNIYKQKNFGFSLKNIINKFKHEKYLKPKNIEKFFTTFRPCFFANVIQTNINVVVTVC